MKDEEDAQKKMRTLEDDVSAKGGALDDHGVVFENTSGDQSEDEPAEMKRPESTEKTSYEKSDSILTNKDDVFDVSGAFSGTGESGTIITDKKRKRRSVASMFADALTEWIGKAKEKTGNKKLKKDEQAGSKVAPARTRKETIQKASENVARAPTDDHKVVLEKIRTLDTDAERITGKPYLIKDKSEKAPEWTHKKETAPASSVHVTKTKLTPGDERSFVAPQVGEHSRELYTKGEKDTSAKKPKKVEKREKPEVKKEHSISPRSTHAAGPLPKHEVKPSKSRREKARKKMAEKKVRQKRKFSWISFLKWLFGGASSKPKGTAAVAAREHEHAEEKGERAERSRSGPDEHGKEVRSWYADEKKAQDKMLRPTEEETREGYASQEETTEKPQTGPVLSRREQREKGEGQASPNERPEETPSVQTAKTKKPRARKKVHEKESSRAGNTLVLAGTVLLAVALGVGASYIFVITQKDAGVLELPSRVVSFLVTDAQAPVPLGTDRGAFLAELDSTIENTDSGITQVYPVRSEAGEDGTMREVPATAQEVFSVLEPRVPSSFIRSLEEDMMIGTITTAGFKEPFLIVRSNDFDIAFAGMLDWEPFMSADLTPVFGPPVSRTYDENARTLDNTIDATFEDVVVNNHGTRVLRDENADERIIYTFLDRETIIITTNTTALAALLEAQRAGG